MKEISREKFEELKNKKKVVNIKPPNQENNVRDALAKSQYQATKVLTDIAVQNINNQNTEVLIGLLSKQNQQIEALLKVLTTPKKLVINHNNQGIIKSIDIKIVK